MVHARKLEPSELSQFSAPPELDDASELGQREAITTDDKRKIYVTGTDDDLTRKLNMLEAVALLARETVDPETFGASSGIKTYSFVNRRVGWARRVSNWYGRD